MRKMLMWGLAAVTLGACSQDVSGPGYDDLFAFAGSEFGSVAYGMPGMHPGRALPELGRLKALPDSLKLTAEQEAEIDALLVAFQAANEADLAALATIMEAARAARAAGKTRPEVAAILAPAREIHQRLLAARLQLHAAIDAVLTAAQKSWLSARRELCTPGSVVSLTDAQKAQIRALYDAFQQANQADLEAVRAAMEQARAARQAGATREQVQAILAPARDAMTRLQAAGDALRAAIDAVLTPEQRASNCFGGIRRMGPGPGPMGGHR